jgi:hypothetical protein
MRYVERQPFNQLSKRESVEGQSAKRVSMLPRRAALTLHSPHGTHFTVASDGHGGTKVTLGLAHTATIASAAPHSLGEEHGAADVAPSTSHVLDYLFVA